MSFELTTRSLLEWPAIHREHELADLLGRYQQLMQEKHLPDNGLLTQAWTILQQRLEQCYHIQEAKYRRKKALWTAKHGLLIPHQFFSFPISAMV